MSTTAGTPNARHRRWATSCAGSTTTLRRDLASGAGAGRPSGRGSVRTLEVRDGLAELEARGPLFQLRANCLGYCQLLHSHHGGEDAGAVPGRPAGGAAPRSDAVDRLEADHRKVSAMLNEIEALAHDLDDASRRGAALVEALTRLSTGLLEHLAYEEETIGPVLDGWDEWPG